MNETQVTDDAELIILETIQASERRNIPITQRELAEAGGLSLGMTNALLKRFSEKGWLMLKKLNARTIVYALTPDGINEIARRTYRYFRRTARLANLYKERIESFIVQEKQKGLVRIILLGISDVDFLFEYACERHNILLVHTTNESQAEKFALDKGTRILIGEAFPKNKIPNNESWIRIETILIET
ncbi:MAG TPA: winged helix-turn-helix transcriptional regulator [Spirochaetia bacterium]|nr:winged helix-turn-helix transcriptional regulator [Spirochaetales bacterium]HRS64673.1 winged helix-turn-helix transcriptional regulator [Spirochaetia bacterium]HPD79625.1 winged helix-turn-helix transcriptional regulator [Spirochaetales bacterium]HQG39412.1 winged helix-turn-helix transcriptional regulator [Spirochaetales bacterium]HQK33809.1 winged helix-turn-helix transcriptional regulator [Spirochaetales bacterium]